MKELKINALWKRTNEIYSLTNDQRMKNVDNLISPSGKVVSVFLIEEESVLGMHMFDKMLRDYKEITPNLKLLIKGRIKLKEKMIPIYIIKENISKAVIAHMFFQLKDKLYVLIFNIDKSERSLKGLIVSNPVFKESIKLLEENL